MLFAWQRVYELTYIVMCPAVYGRLECPLADWVEDRIVKTKLLDIVESGSIKKEVPYFEIGDTVEVQCKIVEGAKERIQIFSGTVIARRGRGINEMFTVRRLIGNEGVERVFPLHSPNVVDVKPIRSGKVRRAKLYFLRDRVGKGVRLKQRQTEHTRVK